MIRRRADSFGCLAIAFIGVATHRGQLRSVGPRGPGRHDARDGDAHLAAPLLGPLGNQSPTPAAKRDPC